MILADTSVVIAFLRGDERPAARRLAALDREPDGFRLPGVVCQEVLQGARNEREWRLLDEYLGTQRLVHATDPWFTHREAARIYFDCRRRGLTIRSTVDCWIAQLALEHEATLLHDDDEFERLARVVPLRTLRA